MSGDIPHPWDLTPQEAIALQKRLAPQVDTHTPLDLDSVRLVAGVDVSVKDNVSRAAIVVLTFPALKVVEAATARLPTPFPYVSGLLSFREGPVILAARRNLSHQPNVTIFDGQGIAHFRRIGIASHIGLWWDAPTVGCAKSRLVGAHAELGPEKGAFQPLWHNKEQVGVILRTRTHVKPVYVSVGHRITLDSARELVLRCTTRYRLPEPIRAAHNTAGAF
ncbi:MAG: deoxyribonuclease V [Chloroflexota bacterium]